MIASLLFRVRGEALHARASRSAVWTISSFASLQFLRLSSNLILTRILFPEAFGMMALVQVLISGLAAFSDMGIHASIIRSDRSHDPDFLNTAWTLQIARGVLLWLISFVIALPVAALYNEPMLGALLPVAGLTALISGFSPTRAATTNRDLTLGRITVIDVASQLIGILLTVGLAWAMQSVWALVFGSISSVALNQVMLTKALPGYQNKLHIDRSAFEEIIRFGRWIFLSSTFGFMVNHADRLILSRFISLDMLGVYSVGLLVASLPMLVGQLVASKVLMPIYKQRPPWENEHFRRKINLVRWFLTGALLAISATFVLLGTPLIQFLFDARYTLAGPILVLIVISQLPAVVLCSYDQILLAAGDSKRFMTRLALLSVVQTTLVVLGVMHFGLIGAIVGRGAATVMAYPAMMKAMRRYHNWHQIHDAVYAVISLAIAALGLWINEEAIASLITRPMPS